MRPRSNAAGRSLLRGLSRVYGAVVRVRNTRFERPGAARRAPLPVLSVGNLTVGGTGKTPVVAWLAVHLLSCGRRPAVVSRGYGGNAGRGPRVVSRGAGPRCTALECGDEPFLLARMLEGVTVIVGSDRLGGAERARALGADVVVLDDGFQHRRLARDLDVVLLDSTDPFGGHALLPAGTLREPLSSLSRADVVLVTRSGPAADSFAAIERAVRKHNLLAPVLRAGHRSLGFFDVRGGVRPRPERALAFCGIGNPQRFRLDLEGEGLELVGFEALRDHHRFTSAELAALRSRASRAEAALVTTEKDLARLGDAASEVDNPTLLVLRIEAVVYDPDPLIEAVDRALGTGR